MCPPETDGDPGALALGESPYRGLHPPLPAPLRPLPAWRVLPCAPRLLSAGSSRCLRPLTLGSPSAVLVPVRLRSRRPAGRTSRPSLDLGRRHRPCRRIPLVLLPRSARDPPAPRSLQPAFRARPAALAVLVSFVVAVSGTW